MTASRTGGSVPVKALLARGADVKAKEKTSRRLNVGAAEGHTEVVSCC